MEVLIENYRGFNIYFDSTNETFNSSALETTWNSTELKTSKSYSSVKKFVDDFIKENHTFEPFVVRLKPTEHAYSSTPVEITIIGIRKDGRFVYENSKGERKQIDSYDEKKYLIYNLEDENLFARIAILEVEVDNARKRVEEAKKSIQSPTLESVKSKYLIK